MAIVTISRGTLSGGRRLATCLAAGLGYQVISREVLAEAARRYGVDEGNLIRGVEQPPSFWERFRTDRLVYLEVIRATLCQLVRQDNVVYHGHAGHMLLQGVEHVLRVRVIAPMAYRVRAAMATQGLGEKEAEAYIRRKDEERSAWTRFLHGVAWDDPGLYDLTFNLENMTVEAACEAIVRMVERPEFRMTVDSMRRLEDLYVASHVRSMLFLHPKIGTGASKIEVTASSGVVRLAGLPLNDPMLAEAIRTCRQIPEVKEVQAG